MIQGNIKVIVTGILILIIIYMILKSRTERIKRKRKDNQSRFRRNR